MLALVVFEPLTEIATRPECKATNRAGDPCRHPVVLPSGFCIVHDAEHHVAKRFGPGPEHTTGFQPRARVSTIDLVREILERQPETVLRPYLEALQSDDPELAMRAGERLFDRGFGKPKQVSEVAHSGGITLEQLLVPTPLAKTNTPLPEEDE